MIAETEISICDYNDCSQGAQCIPDSSTIGYRCECKPVEIDGIELEPIGDGFSCSISLTDSISGSLSSTTSGGASDSNTGSIFDGELYPGIDLKPIVIIDGPTLFYTLRWGFKLMPAS